MKHATRSSNKPEDAGADKQQLDTKPVKPLTQRSVADQTAAAPLKSVAEAGRLLKQASSTSDARPPSNRRLTIGASEPHIVDVHATPPMGPSPDAPWKPEWWRDGEDDQRAAEMLFMLFSGSANAAVHKDIDDWVVRGNPVAEEAFPHVAFWKEQDIRFLRYSCEHGGVAQALQELKASFVSGAGHMKFLSITGGARHTKRPRRLAGDDASASHPVQSLRRV